MTGYTVHTGSTRNFTNGWDRIFSGPAKKTASEGGAPKKAAAKKATKQTATKSNKVKGTKKGSAAKPAKKAKGRK